MQKLKKRHKKQLIAVILVLLLLIIPFGGLPMTIANGVDDGVHYLNYSEDQIWTLLAEAMYPTEEEALFPLEDALRLVETPEMQESIRTQMDGKVLLEKIDRRDGCVAYLMMNPETYELALIAINSGEENHLFELAFGVEPTDGKLETYALEEVEEAIPDEKEEATPPTEGEDGTTPPTEGGDDTTTPPTEGGDDTTTPPTESEDGTTPPATEGEDDATPPTENENDTAPPATEESGDAPTTEGGGESAPSESAPTTDSAPTTVGLTEWIDTVATVFTVTPALAAEAAPADNGGDTATSESTSDSSTDSEPTGEPSSPNDDGSTGDDTTPPDAVTPPTDDTTTPGAPSDNNTVTDPKEPENVVDSNAPQAVIITEEVLPQVEAVPMMISAKGVGVVSFSMPKNEGTPRPPDSYVSATLYDYKDIKKLNGEINGGSGKFFIGSGSGNNGYSNDGWNKWTGNTGGVYLGLAESKLADGASGDIQFTHGTGTVNLFPAASQKEVLGEIEAYPVEFPLVDAGGGYYEYDSNDNYHVELNKQTGDLAFIEGRQKLNGSSDGQGKNGFFPFNGIKGSTNYYFGMKLGFDFMMPKDGLINGGDPMVFEFRGDDDVWIFIDGQLVLDLGGIHNAYEGSINFHTGEMTYEMVNGGSAPTANLYKELEIDQTDYQNHTLTMFYMERGAGKSNCKVKFNLPTIPKGSVNITKKVEKLNDTIASQTPYQFKLYTGKTGESATSLYTGEYTVNGTLNKKTSEDGVITINGGQMASVPKLESGTFYRVEELANPNADYTTRWSVDGADPENVTLGLSSPILSVGTQASVSCINKYPVNPDLPDLEIKKEVSGSLENEDIDYRFQIKLNGQPYKGYIFDANSKRKLLTENDKGIVTLKKNQIVRIKDLPEGAKYEVTELNLDNKMYQAPNFMINGKPATVVPSEAGSTVTNYTVTGEIAWLELDENGKPIDENQDSRVVCNNTNLDNGKITVTKYIEEVRVAHGDPIYVITLEQLAKDGKTVLSTNHQYVRFENGRVENETVTFDNLPLGQYRVKESQALRYTFSEISGVSTNGWENEGKQTVTFNLAPSANEGTATFSDTKYQEQWFSHTDVERSSFILKSVAEEVK